LIELLQIGTAPNKNIERLIPSLKGLNVRLTIIGKVSDSIKESLEKNTVQHNIKDWKLSDEEMLQEYQQTDILTFVSTIEGFGMPIVEANRVGRIVVTSNVSSMPEIAGDAAIFVDPLKVSSIRNGMVKAIETLANSNALIQKGYVNAQRFDVKQLAENYASIYRKIVGRRA
jgi:glycosyltransferase involved in cell wall biosynthesis